MELEQATPIITALPCWTGKVRIQPIAGGMTNTNFVVTDQKGKHFVRLGGNIPVHGIVRRHEVAAAKAAASLGFAPAVLYSEEAVTVFEFVEGRMWQPEDTRRVENRQKIVKLLKQVQRELPLILLSGPPPFFWVFHTIRHYLRALTERQHRLLNQIKDFPRIAAQLEEELGWVKIVYGHNDLIAANFIENGEKLWLLDWEYSGFNSELFDLSGLAANNGWSEEEERWLLEHYFEHPLTERQQYSYFVMKCAAAMRETLWSMTAEIFSPLQLDFTGYTAQTLQRFNDLYAQFCVLIRKNSHG